MIEEKYDQLGPLLGAVGELAADEIGGDPNGIYLYVEVGDRWISVNLFRDEGDVIRYYSHDDELSELIWQAWEAESLDSKKRWAVMEYEIRDGKFDAQFIYPDQVDVESYDVDRREIALRKRFGDKPIIYPPMPNLD